LARLRGVAGAEDDNQTTSMNTTGNTRLYQASGLASVHRALKDGGTAVYWSAGEEPAFVDRFGKGRSARRASPPKASGAATQAHLRPT
jgi:hypothetical protein